jgi:hypothetical protein
MSGRKLPSIPMRSPALLCLGLALAGVAWPLQAQTVQADVPTGTPAGAATDKIAYKLTPTYLSSSDGNNALDLNLRGAKGAHTAWVAQYRDEAGFVQARTGYEHRRDMDWLRTVLSIQLASGGFAGGAATAEVGGDIYAIVGWGRTNLRNYYNLNFDPNDAITLGLGTRLLPQTELSVFQIRDDRLDTQQRVTHAVVRYKASESERWTVDFSLKSGMANDGTLVEGTGLTVTYDFGDYFVRLARDPYANFSNQTQTRFALGLRF